MKFRRANYNSTLPLFIGVTAPSSLGARVFAAFKMAGVGALDRCMGTYNVPKFSEYIYLYLVSSLRLPKHFKNRGVLCRVKHDKMPFFGCDFQRMAVKIVLLQSGSLFQA